jgi:hypothetical protein
MSSGAVLAPIVQQPVPDVFPNRVRAIQPEGIGLLNLDGATATQTFHAKQVPRDFGQPSLLDR